ncbi:MAG: nucleotidyltransferase domain-containing protein [Deltaproteobacteria bacterium]|nr:nucleotidyltransferase domain-containing protein [Deltaproteobacteria bacterium]MBN2673696.1 nucleotidyltransferase domain-containing protein [Deltaproteobacteria bacterium]
MTWTLKKLRDHKSEIDSIAQKHRVVSLLVIGSVARGEATEQSDVDFIAKFEEGSSLMDLGEFIMDLEDSLCCHVDVISQNALDSHSFQHTMAEAVSL